MSHLQPLVNVGISYAYFCTESGHSLSHFDPNVLLGRTPAVIPLTDYLPAQCFLF